MANKKIIQPKKIVCGVLSQKQMRVDGGGCHGLRGRYRACRVTTG
jgi:hypothetical protein